MESKNKHYVYCITHKPSGLMYVGQYTSHPQIRLVEHLYGHGSILIWDMICSGASPSEFKINVLEKDISKTLIYARESFWVKELDTSFPTGLNAGFSSSTYTSYKRDLLIAKTNGWCAALVFESLITTNKETALQTKSMTLAKFQSLDYSIKEYDEWCMNRKRGYSRKNVFSTSDMSNFFIAREKEYERVRRGEFTSAELAAQANRSNEVTRVWDNRTPEERRVITAAGALAVKGKIWINNKSKNKLIHPQELENFSISGWTRGLLNKPHLKHIKSVI